MKNQVQRGDTISFSAGSNLAGGELIILGSIAAVVVADVANGEIGVAITEGVHRVKKTAGVAMPQGSLANYLTATKAAQAAAPGGGLGYIGIGVVWDGALAADAEVNIKLHTAHATAAA